MNGMGWVVGALVVVLAIALVIAGATGHAQALFTGVTGKTTKGGAASSSASQSADTALQTALSQLAGATPQPTNTGGASASPYGGLGPATTTNPAGSV